MVGLYLRGDASDIVCQNFDDGMIDDDSHCQFVLWG